MRTDLGWRLDPAVTFLNHGSYGACPRAGARGPARAGASGWRREPVRFLSREPAPACSTRRGPRSGRFLGADPEGLAFVPNATTGVNTVLASLRFEPGDELLANDHEYNATLNAMRAVAARDGATVVVARIPFPIARPDEVVAAILAAVTPRTRLVARQPRHQPDRRWSSRSTSSSRADARGIDTLVDGAHAPGMVPLDLDALGAAY